MSRISSKEIQKLYALGAKLGLVESGNKEDDFHTLVYGLTRKDSVRNLTDREFILIQNELQRRLSRQTPKQKKEIEERQPGMMSREQIGKAWHLIYQLAEFSGEKNAPAGHRMVGAIKKICDVDAEIQDPFRWLTAKKGHRLIEGLKRYLKSAKAKEKRKQA